MTDLALMDDERSPRPVRGNAHRIAVASGKGGVGKTWFSITLAHAFAAAGQPTLLFDGDLGLANIDVQLGLAPDIDLSEALAGRARLEDTVIHGVADGLDVLAGSSGTASLARLPQGRVDRLIADLARLSGGYSRTVLDLGAGVDGTVRSLAGCADTIIVVTTGEPTALTDAYAFVKLMHLQHEAPDIRIVVNQAAGQQEGERVYQTLSKACERFLSIRPPLAGIVRTDRKVADAIRHQAVLLTRHPNAAAAEDVERIAAGLMRGD